MITSEVYLEDCVEGMKRYADNHFDLAIVDPPYGLGDKLTKGGTWSVKWQDKGADWDKTPSKEYWEQLFRVSKNWIVFGGNYFIEYLPNCRNFIAWHKPYMDGMHSMSNVELALTSFDKNAKKISFNKDKGTEDRIHICQKPIQLYDWILKNYAECSECGGSGEVESLTLDCDVQTCKICKGNKINILDTHLGSGSSRIAAYKGGFNFVGFEIDAEYYEKQEKRFNEFKSQLRFF